MVYTLRKKTVTMTRNSVRLNNKFKKKKYSMPTANVVFWIIPKVKTLIIIINIIYLFY